MNSTPSLFAICPLPGCSQPVDDLRVPCAGCLAAFDHQLRPSAAEAVSAEVFAAVIMERDQAVAVVLAERRANFSSQPGLELAGDSASWRRNQVCWVCAERCTCSPDEGFTEIRWICKNCGEGQ